MSEISGQLLSTKIQRVAGEAAGHNNESALYECAFDNPKDVGAKNISIFVSKLNACWCVLDDGPGIVNIEHILGTGEGLKIKTGKKIGNKLSGEFDAGVFFQASRTLYFSRCNQNNEARKHQQLNVQFNKMVEVVKAPDMDMVRANDLILKGPNKLVKKPEPDTDKFDSDNVEQVKEWFSNNETILNYFDTNKSGMCKVFKYDPDNLVRFNALVNDMPRIIEKIEFITYNTIALFRGELVFKYVDVDNEEETIVDKETCRENFILGRDAIIEEDDEDYEEHSWTRDETFGTMSERALSITNTFYEHNRNIYNRCSLDNYEEDDEFLISHDGKKYYLGNSSSQLLKNLVCTDEKCVGQIPMYLAFVPITEAEEQKRIMNEGTTIESMKQVYIYYHGRYLSRDKLGIAGIQERSLPHFRLVMCLDQHTTKFVNIRAQKSSISLETAHSIIKDTFKQIIKPLVSKLYKNHDTMIIDGVSDWNNMKIDVMQVLGVLPIPPAPEEPLQVPEPPVSVPQVPPIQEPPVIQGYRLASLNKAETLAHLNRLKNRINCGAFDVGSEKKLYTLLNNISKNLVFKDDLLSEYIDCVKTIINASELTDSQAVKEAVYLQDY